MRKPTLHRSFNMSSLKGLTNILVEGVEYTDVLHKVKEIDGLDIIGSGPIPPNPAELLGSNRMKAFIDSVNKNTIW